MVDEPVVVERGVLTVSGAAWDLAVRRAEVIGRLAAAPAVGHRAANAAAAELGVSRRQVYLLPRRWRAGEGLVSDLVPGRSSGGRSRRHLPDEVEAVVRELLRNRYLARQKRSMAAVHRELVRICRSRGWRVPSRGTLARRVAVLDPVHAATARQDTDAARALRAAGGDEAAGAGADRPQRGRRGRGRRAAQRRRLPIGRPYLTVGIDVVSRCIVGLVVTLEAPSALSVGLRLAHMATSKRAWLERLGVAVDWPMSGKPAALYLDNAAEFKSEDLRCGCEQHGHPVN